MARCCLLSEENNQTVYLLICSEAEVVSVKTILMFGEATANCLQVTAHKETKHTAMDVNLLWQDPARPYKQFITYPRSKIYNNVSHRNPLSR